MTIFERLDGPGGRAYVYRQDGFTFDAGPTIVTAPFLLEELWRLCGRRLADDVELRPVSPFYRMHFDDGSVFDLLRRRRADAGANRRALARRRSPATSAFCGRAKTIFRVGFEQLAHVPFGSWPTWCGLRRQCLRLGNYRSVYGFVSRFVKDPRLRIAFSFHPLLIGGNPFSASSIYSLIVFLERRWGVFFAMGGTGRLVQALAGLVDRQGGVIRYGAEVRSILVKDRAAIGVRLASGEEVAADIVVSNADCRLDLPLPAAGRRSAAGDGARFLSSRSWAQT